MLVCSVIGSAQKAVVLVALLLAAGCAAEPAPPAAFEAPTIAVRAQLIRHLWGSDGLPSRGPLLIDPGVADGWIGGLERVERVDRLNFFLPFADVRLSRMVAYHYHPSSGGRRLLIYHDAHCHPFCASSPKAIQYFINRGFAVMYFAMPMYGPNSHVTWETQRGRHNALAEMDTGDVPVMRAFFDQLARGVNYAQQFDYDDISMMGYSGGGWASTVYPAMDPRIRSSFAIAGSMPRYIEDYDEFEQSSERVLYQIADFQDLYYLAALGEKRRHLQLLNLRDPCCWAAQGRERLIERYAADVSAALAERGEPGSFGVYIVIEHEGHSISDEALRVIAARLNAPYARDSDGIGTEPTSAP